ncbi:unnamed protein product [Prorocentrum cordatum]|uniref:Uncharacterized protein n=1 Tax=Prorocentrum cordatum TaxID=2364126 RepID=A0ABN9UPS1_9DINO|nr:unnamed protein product [Polarella glacialis]
MDRSAERRAVPTTSASQAGQQRPQHGRPIARQLAGRARRRGPGPGLAHALEQREGLGEACPAATVQPEEGRWSGNGGAPLATASLGLECASRPGSGEAPEDQRPMRSRTGPDCSVLTAGVSSALGTSSFPAWPRGSGAEAGDEQEEGAGNRGGGERRKRSKSTR